MKDLDKPTVGLVHLQLLRPSVIRGPWIKPPLPTRLAPFFMLLALLSRSDFTLNLALLKNYLTNILALLSKTSKFPIDIFENQSHYWTAK